MLTLSLPCVMKSGPEHTANSTIQSKSFQAKRMPQIALPLSHQGAGCPDPEGCLG